VDDLTREFLLESQEGLDRMERCLTDLETRPGDTELLAEIFRAVHTIKGTTGFLGFSRLEALSHAGENLLGLLREGKLEANPEIVSGLLSLMDILRGVLHSIETIGAEGENRQQDGAIIARLEKLQLGDASIAVAEPELAAVAGPLEPAGLASRALYAGAATSKVRLPRLNPARQGRPGNLKKRHGTRNLNPFPLFRHLLRFLRGPRMNPPRPRRPKPRPPPHPAQPTPRCASTSNCSTA
jgi:two-component system chemotaxis sensor kinase CheA